MAEQPSKPTYENLLEKGQVVLFEFLLTDIDLAFSFLKAAEIHVMNDPKHSASALEKARVTLATIRKHAADLKDSENRSFINTRADELEKTLNTLPKRAN